MTKHILRAALVACLVLCAPAFNGPWLLVWAALAGAAVAWEQQREDQLQCLLVRVRILSVRHEVFKMPDASNREKSLALASLDVAIKEIER